MTRNAVHSAVTSGEKCQYVNEEIKSHPKTSEFTTPYNT